jgi:hypothetical protein
VLVEKTIFKPLLSLIPYSPSAKGVKMTGNPSKPGMFSCPTYNRHYPFRLIRVKRLPFSVIAGLMYYSTSASRGLPVLSSTGAGEDVVTAHINDEQCIE